MTNFRGLLKTLVDAEVEFVVVGAYAAVAQGSSQVTRDLDICYERSPQNLRRLAAALAAYKPRLRGVQRELPFVLDAQMLAHGMNFTLETELGEIDLLGELSGVGQFADVQRGSQMLQLHGLLVRVASLATVIRSKRAAGRPKDLAAIPELEALREVQRAIETEPGDNDS